MSPSPLNTHPQPLPLPGPIAGPCRGRGLRRGLAIALCSAAPAWASSYGTLGNFDVVNDSGKTAHGFEIELEGLHIGDISDVFGGVGRQFPSGRGFDPATAVVRYGAPAISAYTDGAVSGVRVTYAGLFDANAQTWDFGTPSGSFVTPGDNCWTGGGVGFSAGTACDHFGVGTTATPTATRYSWLLEASPGSPTLVKGSVTLPSTTWTAQVPANPLQPGAVAVAARIEVPEPPEPPPAWEFSNALWVKVYTTELEEAPELEDLVGGNAVFDGAVTEIEWQLLQKEFSQPDSGVLEPELQTSKPSVVRRFEFYDFAGTYDANHQASFAAGFGDSLPGQGDVGHYLGAQNGAFNLALAPVPEPSTLALCLAGLVGIGAAVRRRPVV